MPVKGHVKGAVVGIPSNWLDTNPHGMMANGSPISFRPNVACRDQGLNKSPLRAQFIENPREPSDTAFEVMSWLRGTGRCVRISYIHLLSK